jgi:hypothetical protein
MTSFKLAVTAFAVAAPLAFAAPAFAENQPHMDAGMAALKAAETHLDKAAHDKGGHRAKAVELIKQAEAEVAQGIQYANQHPKKK